MNESLGVLGTPHVSFLALVIIGGFAGWIAGNLLNSRHGVFTNILIGIAGSWIGSELASLAHVVVVGSLAHFLAALIGSCVIIYLWQMIHARPLPPQ